MTTNRPSKAPPRTLGPVDIYYALARHKGKILICTALGILAGAGLLFLTPKKYRSEAVLLVRYVVDTRATMAGAGQSQVSSPDARGETVVAAEAAILGSFDVARETVDSLSPNKVNEFMAPYGGIRGATLAPAEVDRAASIVQSSLSIAVPRRGSTINLAFDHPVGVTAQETLTKLVEAYLRKHKDVHRPAASSLATSKLKTSISDHMTNIARLDRAALDLLISNDVPSVAEKRKFLATRIERIEQEISETTRQLEEREALKASISQDGASNKTETVVGVRPPQQQLDAYKSVADQLAATYRAINERQTQFTEESPLIKGLRAQVQTLETEKRAIEAANPTLTLTPLVGATNRMPVDLVTLEAQINALTATKARLERDRSDLTTNTIGLSRLEFLLANLEREKRIQETNYAFMSLAVQQTTLADVLGEQDASNISEIQKPSPAFPTTGKTVKAALGLVVGGLVLGLALAFLSEFYLDRTVRRPIEVSSRLNAPLFISIPEIRMNGRALLAAPAEEKSSDSGSLVSGAMAQAGTANSKHMPAVWQQSLELQQHIEALRDRLVTHFEALNLVHKPKLVAVTACAEGAGVSTIAGGLAASLSENSEGNVLLVDMHGAQGSAHPFYRGKPMAALADALDASKRTPSAAGSRLFVARASEADDRLAGALPRRFGHLVPKMKASDLDYIIFDMPPVSQVSVTSRLSGFMDMVFLVIESERTRQESVERALSLLADSRASVALVLNRGRNYLPKRLQDAV